MNSIPALSILVCTVVLGPTLGPQRGARPAAPSGITSTQLPASPTVLITVVGESNGDLTIPKTLILWRGAPKWYLSSPQRSSGGGSGEYYQVQQSYGDVELSLQVFQVFSRPTKIAINGIDVADTGANVFLVDGVDRGSIAPTIIGVNVALASGSLLEAALTASGSPEVRKFLQCPSATSPAWLVCNRLGGGV